MKTPPRSLLGKIAVLFLLAAPCALHAQTTYQWDPSGNGSNFDGGGIWSTTQGTFYNSGTDTLWPNSTSDVAVFGPANSAGYSVSVSGALNAGGITLQSTGNGISLNGTNSATITGPTAGTFVTTVSAFFPFDGISNIAFTGASTYQFDSFNSTVTGDGVNIAGSTTFNGNVVAGNGTDEGELFWNVANGATGTVTVNGTSNGNGGWTLVLGNGNFTYNDSIVLNGFGTRGNGTIAFLSNGQIVAGPIALTSDASIFSQSAGTGTNSNTVSGSISGNYNLYLGFWNNQTSTGVSKEVISSTGSTYTGATIITNGSAANSIGGVSTQRVVLGATNALPTSTVLVMGFNGSTAAVSGAATVFSMDNNSTGNDSEGAFDLNGFNQQVGGLTTGAGQSASDVALNVIGNNSGTGNSVLTVSGNSTSVSGGVSTTNANTASTYAGTIEDNFGTAGGTVGLSVTGGSLTLSGTNNTYSGGTTVTNGTLSVNNASGSATGAGPVTVSGTSGTVYGTLAGGTPGTATTHGKGGATSAYYNSGITTSNSGADSTGYIAGTGADGVTINSKGHLAPGSLASNIGTLTVGDLTLNNGAVMDYEYDGSYNDFTAVNGALSVTGPVTFNFDMAGTSTGVTQTGVYDLLSYGSLGTTFVASDFTLGNPQTGLAYNFVDDTTDDIIQLDITTAATPEPSTWALLLGGVALLGFVIRRRSFNS